MTASVVSRLRAAGCVFAEDEARLLLEAAATRADLDAMVSRRVSGLPLEHVLGWAEFLGLRITVAPGVFVPRRRTELLARQAATLAGAAVALVGQGAVVVDLCCGSGAVGAAVHAAVPGIELYAVDIEPAAVRCARENITGTVYEGDLYAPLPGVLHGRVAVLVANAPYVPTEAVDLMPPEARLHEPLVALDGGTDGLDVLRRVIAGAPLWLVPDGHLLFETSAGQASAAADTVATAGLTPDVVIDDLGTTVVIGRLHV
jgi:release factor glutamine methyltransferase